MVVVLATAGFLWYQRANPTLGLALTTEQVKIGDSYFATASGFPAGADVRFSWTGPTEGEMGVFPADPNGESRDGPIIERDPPGQYTIIATDVPTGRTATAAILVVADQLRPTPLPTAPSAVPPGPG